MSDIQMELAKEEALSELRQIAVEAVTIFHSSQCHRPSIMTQ